MEIVKTIGIKLKTTIEQENELNSLFEAYRVGINWSLKEIEKRYLIFKENYTELEKPHEGRCPVCKDVKDKRISYQDKAGNNVCTSCATHCYSEYTIRKEIYGAGDRKVESDLKDITDSPNKTHYTMMFSQAYTMWKSFNAWRLKRKREAQKVKEQLEAMDSVYYNTAQTIEKKAYDLKLTNKKLTWKTAKAMVFKEIYQGLSETECEAIESAHDKLMSFKQLSRPLNLPELDECRTVMMSSNFVSWKKGKLYATLFHKGTQELDYWGKEYLNQFIPKMEEDNNAYCNITKKSGEYYIMYPLTIEVKQPLDIKKCDTFVYISSPNRAAIMGYDTDGVFQSVKFFDTGKLAFIKRHMKEKRKEIASRKSPEEKMRHIRHRKKKLIDKQHIEARISSTFTHQVTRKMIDYIMDQSDRPRVVIWDIGNGITQNFGKNLNYRKSLWPAVQQQEYLKHKAMQVNIPVVEIKYNSCNDLMCSSCGAKQFQVTGKKKKPMKVITQLIKGVKNFKCNCGYETNSMINQGNNVVGILLAPPKK